MLLSQIKRFVLLINTARHKIKKIRNKVRSDVLYHDPETEREDRTIFVHSVSI